ncbi:hypothetical protein EJ05DRAFT_487370 [Pseudovirgaria hyperparasitica]|uniref:C2H2-type domain-containing protein n=1 Tax=Pseudovirgaria hyperparasitica TaxID=470096 RepID=A0A6A6W0M1_9PEZI|nr:uncharacterized protein EJ05DRAFT_487370 [Pseudovirgaria hyperparasitica]KAF2756468.1 hypothetical protein EJ05DRAFT_487370 [Pseudovirgaria hyperparasitica]
MATSTALKRPAEVDIGILSKKPRFCGFQPDSENNSVYSPGKSTPGSPDDTHSDGTDITHPSPKGEARRLNAYVCPFDGCGKTYNRPCRLEDHIRSHTQERPYVCTYEGCDKSFLRDTHLNRHIKSAHTNERKYACEHEGCGKSFLTNQRLKAHQQVHSNAERFRCTDFPPCNQTFRKHKTLQAHIVSAHFHKKPFQCAYVDETTGRACTHAYETRQKLENHTNRVHGGERFFCTICGNDEPEEIMYMDDGLSICTSAMTSGAGFKTYNALQTHIKEVHPPTCDPCGLAFGTHRELRRHIELSHPSTLPLSQQNRSNVCAECGKSFTKPGNLKVHIQVVHRKDRRFACLTFDFVDSKHAELVAWTKENACDAAFTTKQQLETHVRTEHLGMESAWHAKRRAKLKSSNVEVRKAAGTYHGSSTKRLPLMTELTGVGYEDYRPIACLRSGCDTRFYRDYDLQVHCSTAHGMADIEIAEAVREREALSGGQFWLGGVDPNEADEDDRLWNAGGGFADFDADGTIPQGPPLANSDGEDYNMADAVMQFLHSSDP